VVKLQVSQIKKFLKEVINLYKKYDFSLTEEKWSWQELLFGLENKIIGKKDIINYATHVLEEDIQGFDLVLQIAIADEHEDIVSYLHELCHLETPEQDSFIKDKWRYVLLKGLYQQRADVDNFNGKVEEIYADFDYPEDMAGFIGYMPSIEGKSMDESWQEYLKNAKDKFESY
jgi:hypothetical protein